MRKATAKLLQVVEQINNWTKKFRKQLNQSKSVHIHFINKNITHIHVTIYEHQVIYSNTEKYLGPVLDDQLR